MGRRIMGITFDDELRTELAKASLSFLTTKEIEEYLKSRDKEEDNWSHQKRVPLNKFIMGIQMPYVEIIRGIERLVSAQ